MYEIWVNCEYRLKLMLIGDDEMANVYASTIMNLILVYGMKIIIGLLVLYFGFKITDHVTKKLIGNLKKKSLMKHSVIF